MKYSVIIPAYNAENDILSCLKSISIQSFNDYEIIVINDGSTDSTLEVCADFKKKNANLHMIIKTVPNGGPGKARNEGLKMASGEKILFVDADDKVELNYFETLEKYNEKNYDFLCFGIIHHHQKKIRKGTEPFFLEGKNISSKFIDLYLGKGDLHSSVNKCFNKKFLIENNIFFPEGTFVEEDLIFNLRALNKAEQIASISENLYNYLCKDFNSITTSYNPKKFEMKKHAFIEEMHIINHWGNRKIEQLLYNNYLLFLSSAVNNLFYKECFLLKKEKLCLISQWFNDKVTDWVISNVKSDSLRSRVMYYLAKYRFVKITYYLHLVLNKKKRG